jgi:hypothetical protein
MMRVSPYQGIDEAMPSLARFLWFPPIHIGGYIILKSLKCSETPEW